MRLRLTTFVAIATFLTALTVMPALGSTAAAAPARAAGSSLSLTGTLPSPITNAAGTVIGTLNSITVTGFQNNGGVLQAIGTASVTAVGSTTAQTLNFVASLAPSSGAACPILSLSVGAINLDLLGLVVTTNQINLNITAQPGPGNLLGNLLCAVSHLLDNTTGNGLNQVLNQVVGLLNQILAGGVLTL